MGYKIKKLWTILSTAGLLMCLITPEATAQDVNDMQVEIKLDEHIRFGRTEEIRQFIVSTPDFTAMTASFQDIRLLDKLLCDAVDAKQVRVEIVEMLLDQGAEASGDCVPITLDMVVLPIDKAVSGYVATLPQFALTDSMLGPPLWPATRSPGEDYIEVAQILIDEMMDPDLSRALLRAAYAPEFVAFLLENGADPDKAVKGSISPRDFVETQIDQAKQKLQLLKGDAP